LTASTAGWLTTNSRGTTDQGGELVTLDVDLHEADRAIRDRFINRCHLDRDAAVGDSRASHVPGKVIGLVQKRGSLAVGDSLLVEPYPGQMPNVVAESRVERRMRLKCMHGSLGAHAMREKARVVTEVGANIDRCLPRADQAVDGFRHG